MNECSICCEKFSKLARCRIECGFCPKDTTFKACSACVKRYLTETSKNAHCMNCKHAWNRVMLYSILPKKFINETYRKHRQNILEEREKSMMPATQPFVELENMRIESREKNRELEKYRYDNIHGVYHTNALYYSNTFLEKKIYCVRKEHELEIFAKKIRDKEKSLKIKNSTNDKTNFVRQCPSNDCKGFLNSSWTCGLCKAKVCSKCHEIKYYFTNDSFCVFEKNKQIKIEEQEEIEEDEIEEDEIEEEEEENKKEEEEEENKKEENTTQEKKSKHICDPNMIETAKLLNKDSKPCPTCGSFIFKIEGCDQMFCTQCHTGFSWLTGNIEKGNIHNPHYFEYLREQANGGEIPRNPLDNPCGELGVLNGIAFTNDMLRYIIGKMRGRPLIVLTNNQYKSPGMIFSEEIALCNHISDPVNRCILTQEENIDGNRDLRIEFMMNKISDEVYKQSLQLREKRMEKVQEYDMIYRTYVMAARDIILNCINLDEIMEDNIIDMWFQLQKLREYVNECFRKLKPIFNCKVPFINFQLHIDTQ